MHGGTYFHSVRVGRSVEEVEEESGLLPSARFLLGNSLGYTQGSILEEVATPWGRPDLLAFSGPYPGLGLEGLLGRSEIILLRTLERTGPLRECEIASLQGVSSESARAQIGDLLSRGLVRERGDMICACGRWSHLDSLCAVELKLGDWRRGLLQALRYRVFADLVYVFLSRMPSTLNVKAFSRGRIGLAKLGDDPKLVLAAERVSGGNVTLGRMLVEENIRKSLRLAMQRPCEGT